LGVAKQPETRLKEKVLRDMRTLPRTYAEKIQQVAKRGTPDILACVNGHFVALELKSGTRPKRAGKFTLQDWVLEQITHAQGLALKVYPEDWSGVFKQLAEMAGTKKDEGH